MEGAAQSTTLIEEKETFNNFVVWRYTTSHSCPEPIACSASGLNVDEEQLAAQLYVPVNLFSLAKKLQIKKLKKQIIDILFEHATVKIISRLGPNKALLSYVYENTLRASGLSRLMVGWMGW